MNYYEIILNSNSRYLDRPYTYKSKDEVHIGNSVFITFGKGDKEFQGFIIGRTKIEDLENVDLDKIKEIIKLDEDFSLTEEIIETAIWMKYRYDIKYIDGIRCFLPGKNKPKRKIREKAFVGLEIKEKELSPLTKEQKTVWQSIEDNLDNSSIFLLHGITGSGKTRIYLEATKKVLETGKEIIVLVPEIGLTKQLIERFASAFGKEKIAVLHSKLKPSERYLEWEKIRKGKAKITIGARLAIFSPVTNLGLIIIDEEHESTYKSDMTPKYETVDIAYKRMSNFNASMILGSATPSVISYKRAEDGIYKLVEMKERYNKNPLPEIEIIDMKEELFSGNSSIFSQKLLDEMNLALKNHRQIILFMNRRGYSNFVLCKSCGEVLRCKECNISLTYHKKENSLVCHYCDRHTRVPSECPNCKSEELEYIGEGTENIEEQIGNLFKEAKVSRLDLDVGKTPEKINEILWDFEENKIDILVGTQLVAKGLDFKNVGLVGVLAADNSLNIPDYRASERTFQLITQVAGRAGRGDYRGKVVVQTYNPKALSIIFASKNDYKGFFCEEIEGRKLLNYPPFTDFISVDFVSSKKEEARAEAENFYKFLDSKNISWKSNIFKPKEANFFMGNNRHKYFVLIKVPKGKRGECLTYTNLFRNKSLASKKNITMVVDINPYTIT